MLQQLGPDPRNLAEILKVIREAEFTIASGAGSLNLPDSVKDEATANEIVEHVVGNERRSGRRR
jgi:hypothetical protein